MPVIESRLSLRSADFIANAEKMRSLVADLKDKVAQAAQGGGEKARDKHVARGKLLPRERVDLLLDAGAPFLELSQLAAFGMYGGDVHTLSLIHICRCRRRG